MVYISNAIFKGIFSFCLVTYEGDGKEKITIALRKSRPSIIWYFILSSVDVLSRKKSQVTALCSLNSGRMNCSLDFSES